MPDETKVCCRCNERKVLTDFYVYGKSGKVYGHCKVCDNAQSRKHDHASRSARTAYSKEWRARNREQVRERSRAARAKLKEETGVAYDRDQVLRSRFGISLEEYNRMYEVQGGKCPICLLAFSVLCVDHDHEDGHVRGLLCRECNRSLGTFDKDPGALPRAQQYLDMAKMAAFEKQFALTL